MGVMISGYDCFTGVSLSTQSYSNLLIDINTRNSRSNVSFDAGGSTYNTNAATARAALVSRGWLITDGGPIDPDPFYDNVSLLLLGNGTNNLANFRDSGPARRSVTVSSGNPVITTSQFKYGNGSITGGRIEVPYSPAFDWGTGDFTIEFWFRWSGTLSSEFRFCVGGTPPCFGFGSRSSGGRVIGLVQENVAWDVEIPWTPVGSGTWFHLALVRANGVVTIFQNGVSIGSQANTRNWTMNNSVFVIMPDTLIASSGAWFDDFRATEGVARYTSNFTPPSTELPDEGDLP